MGPTVRTIIPAVLIARPFASFIGNGSRNQPSAVRKSGLRVQRRAARNDESLMLRLGVRMHGPIKILITGANGQVGHELLRVLRGGAQGPNPHSALTHHPLPEGEGEAVNPSPS